MDTQKLLIEIEVDSSQAVQRLVEQKAALEKLKQEKQELQNAWYPQYPIRLVCSGWKGLQLQSAWHQHLACSE